MPTPHNPSPAVKRALKHLGAELKEARLRRRLSAQIVAERAGTTRSTLQKIEQGTGSVSFMIVASVCQAVGLLDNLTRLADIENDPVGRAMVGDQLTPSRAPRKPRS